MSIGYIKIYRQFLNTSFFRDSAAVHLALTLLVSANYKDSTTFFNGEEVTVKRGQLITGRHRLAEQTGLKSSSVRNKLDKLRKVRFLTIKTTNRYSLITICKYNDYQDSQEEAGQQVGQPQDSQRTATGQPQDTSKEGKKGRSKEVKKKDLKDIVGLDEIIDYLNTVLDTKYQKTGQKIKALIRARQNEGHTLDDFKKVIDIKYAEWKNTDRSIYLRPETLFGTKFESYLNQKPPDRQPFSDKTKGNFEMVKRRAKEREEKEKADSGKILPN